MCVLIYFTTLAWNISSAKRIEGDVIEMIIGRHLKHLLFLSDFNESRIFSTYLEK